MEAIVWMVLIIVFLVIEILTVGLTSIWLDRGALAAVILYYLGLEVVWQIAAFFLVSVILMIFTRPFAKKYINSNRTKTNYEEVIGKLVKITEKVDNINETGTAMVNGQEWTARAKNAGDVIEAGSIVRVVEISGVKLIVERE